MLGNNTNRVFRVRQSEEIDGNFKRVFVVTMVNNRIITENIGISLVVSLFRKLIVCVIPYFSLLRVGILMNLFHQIVLYTSNIKN